MGKVFVTTFMSVYATLQPKVQEVELWTEKDLAGTSVDRQVLWSSSVDHLGKVPE